MFFKRWSDILGKDFFVVDGGWLRWYGYYGSCSVICGGGVKYLYWFCNYLYLVYGG